MQIGIKCDGTPQGTNVYDMDTGEKIDNILDVNIQISLNGVLATLKVFNPALELYNIETNYEEN